MLLTTLLATSWGAEPRQLLLIAEPDAPLTLQVTAELKTMGFRVVAAAADETEGASLRARAESLGASAAVVLEPHAGGVNLRVYERSRGSSSEQTIAQRSTDTDSGLLATQVVEALRAALLDVQSGPATATTDKPDPAMASAAEPALPAHRDWRWSVGVGPAAFVARSSTVGVEANVAVQATSVGTVGWGGRLMLRLPVVAPSLSATNATADVTTIGVAPVALLELAPRSRVSGDVGAGASLDWLSVKGKAEQPLEGRASRAMGISPVVAASLGFHLSSRLGLRAHAMAGYLLPVTTVSFADDSRTRWGAPWLSTGLWLTWSHG
ncbi:MAG: hypothetical protein EOO73_11625 [Myxococcales bacterium]|nr:MAG: hypothetical protein EOO73_11625 [Myxococcales bacterium]